MRRRRGQLLPLEESILDVVVDRHRDGSGSIHGFALAKELSGTATAGLIGHGTLYKALARLEKAGLLESSWEDAELAALEARPRRRLYSVTAAGSAALAEAAAMHRPLPQPRTARA